MPSSHTVRMIDNENENGNGNGNGSRSGFTSSSIPALPSPKATAKISSSAQQCKEFTMLVTELIISYATSAPFSSPLPPTCRVCPCLAAAVCHAVLPQQLTAGQAKPTQAKTGQQAAGGSFNSDVFGIFLSCVSLALAPAPGSATPDRRQATSGSQHRSRLS